MSDTIVPPTPTAPEPSAAPETTPTGLKPNPYAQATKELVHAGSWEKIAPTATAPEAPVVAPEPAAPVEEPPEASPEPAADDFAGWKLDEANRLHRPDGTYATSEEVDRYNAGAEPDPTEPAPEPEPKHTVELRKRDGSTRTIEVEDPEIAEELRTNAKDGMRAREYREKVAALDARLAEINAFDKLLETNPAHVFLNVLPPDKQIDIAVKLIAQHWDQLAPTLVQFDTEPTARLRAAMQTQMDVRDGMTQYQSAVQATKQAGELAKATVALIPDTMPDHLHESFLADAQADIVRAVQAGTVVTPQTLPQILANRLTLYGATAPVAPAAPAMTVVRAAPTASPAALPPSGDKAVALAKAQQDRLAATAQARRRAAAVPPSGAGAAPVRLPPVAPGTTIKEASQQLKQLRSW